MNKTALVAYVPALHRGYLELFRALGGVLFLVGESLIERFPSLARHLPGNKPEDVRMMLEPFGIFSEIRILEVTNLGELSIFAQVVMPDEDVSHTLAEQWLNHPNIVYDGRWRLRWHKGAVLGQHPITDDEIVSYNQLDQTLMLRGRDMADRSPDWWRQVGALLVREGEILLEARNTHQPNEQSCYILGDPRSNFEAGERIDLSAALHAETALIALAARRGVKTEGCDLYVTTFPCPGCAYAIAAAGISRLLYCEGYSLIAGAQTLQVGNVRIVRVSPP